MASGFNQLDVVAFLLGLLIAGVAIWLAIRGMFPRRVGDEPRCRQCNYQLTGIASDRCPECGLEISPANTVRGVRPSRPYLAGFAALLFLTGIAIAGVGMIDVTKQMDWYRLRPTSWVIGDIEKSTSTDFIAWGEMNRRLGNGGVSASQQNRLADAAIKTLNLSTASTPDYPWLELMRQDAAHSLSPAQRLTLVDAAIAAQSKPALAARDHDLFNWTAEQLVAGKLSADRQQAFLSHLMHFELTARAKIGTGGPLPYRIADIGRGPSSMGWHLVPNEELLWYHDELGRVFIDDQQVRTAGGGGSTGEGFSDGGSSSWSLDPKEFTAPPGSHTLRCEVSLKIFSGPRVIGDDAKLTPLWQSSFTLTSPFTVLPPGQPDGVASVPDPSLQAAMEKALTCDDAREQTYGGQHHGMEVSINYTAVPADAVFDVFAVIDGKEQRIGTVNMRKGANGGYGTGGGEFDASHLKAVDLILRSSEAATRQTVDMMSIWQGEILIKNVPLRPAR